MAVYSFEYWDTKILSKRDQKRIGCNTTVRRIDNNTIAMKYHATDILVWKRDGTIVIDTNGWHTITTATRINEYGPFRVYSVKGEWRTRLMKGYADSVPELEFIDGSIFDPVTGTVSPAYPIADDYAGKRLSRLIAAYVKGCCNWVAKELKDCENWESMKAKIDSQYAGECLLCKMHGKPKGGESASQVDHIFSHLTEKYYQWVIVLHAARANLWVRLFDVKRNPEKSLLASDLRNYFKTIKPGLLECVKRERDNPESFE